MVIVSFSAPFVLNANCYNIPRAEGQSGSAMMAQVIGNLLNVVLYPILISGLGWGIAGAAVATVIGNTAAALYYIAFFLRGKSLTVNIRAFPLQKRVWAAVLVIGIPAAMNFLLMSVSQIIVNSRMAAYSDMAVAGLGVAMKVLMITNLVCIGFGQGVQPLLGYCVGAGLWDRFREVMRFSLSGSYALSAALTGFCLLFTSQLTGAFLTDPDAFGYAVHFVRILLTTSKLAGVFHLLGNALQGIGAAGAGPGGRRPAVGPAGDRSAVHGHGGASVPPYAPSRRGKQFPLESNRLNHFKRMEKTYGYQF